MSPPSLCLVCYCLTFDLLRNRLYFFLGSGSEAGLNTSCDFTAFIRVGEICASCDDDSMEEVDSKRLLLHFTLDCCRAVSNVRDSR